MTNTRPSFLLLLVAFASIYLIWGTTFLAIVVGLKGFPPFMLASIRFLIAGIILVGYSLLKGEGLPSRSGLVKNAIIGLVVLVGGQGLLIWSEQYIASGYASVLVATLPIWFVILDRSNWSFYFKNIFILIGVVLGFIGIVILFQNKLNEALPPDTIRLQITASVLVLIGAMCWVAGTLYNRTRPAPGTIYHNLGWQLLFGFIFSMILSLLFGESYVSTKATWSAWGAVIYLAIAGSIIAYIAYTWLLKQKPSAVVGTYAYINPVVAVFLGWLLADEVISSLQVTGMVIILISAVLINVNRMKKAN